MYANLKLYVNGKYVTNGTMIKILATLKNLCVMAFMRYKISNLLLKGCIFSNVLAIAFSFIIGLTEDMAALKNKCPLRNTFFCCVWDTKSLKSSLSSACQIVEEKVYFQNIGTNTLFQ